jgi:hypothetical protein
MGTTAHSDCDGNLFQKSQWMERIAFVNLAFIWKSRLGVGDNTRDFQLVSTLYARKECVKGLIN